MEGARETCCICGRELPNRWAVAGRCEADGCGAAFCAFHWHKGNKFCREHGWRANDVEPVKREEKNMNKLFQKIKKHQEQKRAEKQRKQEQFLTNYFSVLYRVRDYGTLQIPHFIGAQQTVEDIKQRGLLEDVYKYIYKKGVAC